MKKLYSFKWFLFNLHVECTKCGNNIVFQDFEGNPICNECGNENKFPWTEALREIGVMEVPSGRLGNRKMIGSFSANANSEPVDFINCYHCNTALLLPDETDINNFNCSTCNEHLSFKQFPEFENLIFYKSGGSAEDKKEGIKPIAVRCVSCGAPLEVDPTKNNFNCKFCSTDNILPMSMRYKVVLADIFVADKKARYPKLFAFEQDGKLVQQVLNENGKSSFQDGELDKILLSEKDDLAVYNMVLNEYKYLPGDKILTELFNTSNTQTIIQLTGTRLQKTQSEIDNRILQVNPNYKKAKKEAEKLQQKSDPKQQAEKQSRKIFETGNVIMFVVFVVVVIVLLYSFGIIQF